MKNFLLITLFFASTLLVAQTKITVIVTNGSFAPAAITIDVGDTVEFVNQLGFHWVDGTQGTFAANPASFDNQSQSGSGWTYNQVFNTAGFYNYRCGIHTTTMSGTITVQAPTGIETAMAKNKVKFYPNPASKELNFTEFNDVKSVALFSLTGEKVLESTLINDNLDISALNSGVYFVKVTTENETVTEKLIIQ